MQKRLVSKGCLRDLVEFPSVFMGENKLREAINIHVTLIEGAAGYLVSPSFASAQMSPSIRT